MTNFTPHSHAPYGAHGSGLYSDVVSSCFDIVDKSAASAMEALENIPFDTTSGKPFIVADYGTADGGTSMDLISKIIDALKCKYGDNQQVLVCYEDQATNDFQSLFYRLHGIKDESKTYLGRHKGVFVVASGTDYFSQFFPNASIHLGLSFTAMQWLFKRPCVLKDAVMHGHSTDMPSRVTFASDARENWERILLHRAEELTPGGHMIISLLGTNNEGYFTGYTDKTGCSVYDKLSVHWKSLVDDGLITQEEFENATLNEYMRTEEECVAPFKDPASPVYKSGLRLVSSSTELFPCKRQLKWQRSGKTAADTTAATEYAHSFVVALRVWSNSSFTSALNETRTPNEKAGLVDEFYRRYEKDIAKNPNLHKRDYIVVYCHIRKQD